MRPTRAYLAGFGTAGSLVAGAATLFVLASAVISFQGWPQVDTTAPRPSIVLADGPARHVSSATARIQSLLAAAFPHRGSPPVVAGAAPGRVRASGFAGVASSNGVSPSARLSIPTIAPPPAAPGIPTPPAGPGPTPSASPEPPACSLICTRVPQTRQPSLPAGPLGALGNTTAGVGSGLGSVISSATGALANALHTQTGGIAGMIGKPG